MNLYLDIETTGLAPKGKEWDKDYKLFPNVVEVAWKLGKKTFRYIVHQDGGKIPKEATAIHGITTAMANDLKLTHSAAWVFQQLTSDAIVASKIIGHNIYFDTSVLKAHAARVFGIESVQLHQMSEGLHKSKRVDTMRAGQKVTGKWSSLNDLHKKLFNREVEDAHTAKGDIIAVEKIYLELKSLGHVS
jgi:DNA polymerase-3 subunit alpha